MRNLRRMMLSATLAAVCGGSASAGELPLVISADDDSLEWGPCPEFMPDGCEIAVLHGDPAAANADVFFRVPGGADIPLHRHASAERMVLVSGELDVTYDGQETATIRVGDYAYGPADLPHSATCAPGDACVLFIAFVEPVDAVPVGGGGE
ncbi:MAG TPA: cupin domain-containing protein [Woeseiaceae bacterium]|nr:cupin domain-containing protein [Woeseiaceae bacterium]